MSCQVALLPHHDMGCSMDLIYEVIHIKRSACQTQTLTKKIHLPAFYKVSYTALVDLAKILRN